MPKKRSFRVIRDPNGNLRKRFIAYLTVGMLVVIIAIIAATTMYRSKFKGPAAPPESARVGWTPRNAEKEIAAGTIPEDVEYGYRLLSATQKYLGPQADDPELRLSGNNLACTSCHINGGTQAGAASFVGVTARFPAFGGRSNSVGTIEDRVNGCLERSMNGRKLEVDSKPMQAIVAYMEWLAEDLPEEEEEYYTGFTDLVIPDVAVDLVRGKKVYNNHCAACHQPDGLGVKDPDFSLGYSFPPIAGDDSYNEGAGMHRVLTAAMFIKANMPSGVASKGDPALTDEAAYHVAGYINSLPRPPKDNTEADFPDRKLKPVSTPYGPWEDDFSAEQHKYGPFPPIIEYYVQNFDITKTK